MRLFKDPKELSEEEQIREAEAKAQVLAWFSLFRPDPTEGRGFKETIKRTWLNLLSIVSSSFLYLTGIFGEGVFVASIMFGFAVAIVLSISAVYFARKDFLRANGS